MTATRESCSVVHRNLSVDDSDNPLLFACLPLPPMTAVRALFIGLIVSTLFGCGCNRRDQTVANAVVLKLNDKTMTTQEFSNQLAGKLKHYDALYAKDESNLARAKADVIKEFSLGVISDSWAKEKGLKVPETELETEIANLQAQYPDPFAFRKALANENLNFEDWKNQFHQILLQKRVAFEIKKDLQIPTEEELQLYYKTQKERFTIRNAVRVRQVVVDREDQATQIYKEIRRGRSLAELAKRYSIAPEGSNGGLTNWIDEGTLEVFDKALKMPIGSRSTIVKSPFGYHIFETVAKRPKSFLPFSEVKDEIGQTLLAEKEQAAYSVWLEGELKKFKIFRNDSIIANIKASTLEK